MMMPETSKAKAKTHFEEIALPHMGYIYKTAYRLTGNKSAAEDLTQDAFFIAMQKFDQLKDQAKCRSWLFAILRNLFLGTIEKTKNKYFLDYEDVAYGLPDHSHKAGELWRDGFSDDVQHQLDRLDEKYKTPLVMSVLGDYSYKEIADSLDIPIGTVMSRIARGKIFLRREILKKTDREELISR